MSDIVMLVVQVGGFLALYVTGRRQLVFVAVVWALSAAAGLSVLWHLGKGHEPRPREDDQEAPRDRLTGWLLGQFLFGAGLSQLLPLFVLPLIGSAAYGGLRAMDALLMPCLTLGVASMPVLLQGLRHSLDTAGRASQARSVARLCGGIGVLTAGYALALLVVSDAAVEVVYGAAYVRYVSLLPYLAAAAVVNTSVLAVGASMRVLRQGRQIFLGQLAGTAASLVVLPLLTLVHGVAGTAQALLIQTVLIAGSSVFLWWRDLGRSRAK